MENEKDALRNYIRAKLKSLSDEELTNRSKEICRKLSKTQVFSKIAFFMPQKTEVQITAFTKECLENGRTCLLPRVNDDKISMDFYVLDSKVPLQCQLEKGSFGILEPKKILKKLDFLDKKLSGEGVTVLVPGLAFDKKGNRLGKGKGFYDRFFEFLAKNYCGKICKIGICFDFQVVENIPAENTDFPVDFLITD